MLVIMERRMGEEVGKETNKEEDMPPYQRIGKAMWAFIIRRKRSENTLFIQGYHGA